MHSFLILWKRKPGWFSRYRDRLRAWTARILFPARARYFPFPTAPTQPRIQWIPGALSPGVKQTPTSADVKNGGTMPPFPHSTSWRGGYLGKLEVSGQLHAPTALPSPKEARYPLDRRFGGPQSRSRRCGEEKILYPTGTRTPTPRSSSP
jgi:hypothetical protein